MPTPILDWCQTPQLTVAAIKKSTRANIAP
jgi:hypothetical protein